MSAAGRVQRQGRASVEDKGEESTLANPCDAGPGSCLWTKDPASPVRGDAPTRLLESPTPAALMGTDYFGPSTSVLNSQHPVGGWSCPLHRWENQGCGDSAPRPRPESWCAAEPGFGPENPESRGHVLPCPKDRALATSLPTKPAGSIPHSQIPDLAAESLLVFVPPEM